MSTFWGKVALVIIAAVGIFFAYNYISDMSKQMKEPQKTFDDAVREDDKKFAINPDATSAPQPQPTPQPVEAQPNTQPAAAAPVQPTIAAPKPVNYRQLEEEDDIEAQRLYNFALMEKKRARLPGMGAKKMVDTCREIIAKYPGTIYEYNCRDMLKDIPERYREMYNIKPEEMEHPQK